MALHNDYVENTKVIKTTEALRYRFYNMFTKIGDSILITISMYSNSTLVVTMSMYSIAH